MDAKVLYKLTYGLYVVGVNDADERPAGCVINTCFQVTSQYPSLVISLNKNNYTLRAIKATKRFTLSIVAEDTDPAIIGKFGFCSVRASDKYADFGLEDFDGVPAVKGKFCGRLLLEATGYVDCGTHELVVARLVDTRDGSGTPMTYAYYRSVIKGSAPKNAPTYQAEDEKPETPKTPDAVETTSGKRRYQCDICGYIVETDGPLPDDYICPLCGADRTHFVEI